MAAALLGDRKMPVAMPARERRQVISITDVMGESRDNRKRLVPRSAMLSVQSIREPIRSEMLPDTGETKNRKKKGTIIIPPTLPMERPMGWTR